MGFFLLNHNSTYVNIYASSMYMEPQCSRKPLGGVMGAMALPGQLANYRAPAAGEQA